MEDVWEGAFCLSYAVKAILCVRFRQWSIDRVRRRRRWRQHEPLVLVQSSATRLTVAFACQDATKAGIAPGMTLAEARATCPGLRAIEHSAEGDIRALHSFARWMIRFSPIVAVEPPDGIFLDVTGNERLFGGFPKLAGLVSDAVRRCGFLAGMAIAPTPGAAWALASYGRTNGAIVADNDVAEAISPLPIIALRLDNEIAATLRLLGIETVGQLRGLPRKSLPSRFGSTVLIRLDQIFGFIAEPLIAIRPSKRVKAAIEFETAVESQEMLLEALRRLIETVTDELRSLGRGAKRLSLGFFSTNVPPVTKDIHLSKPSRRASLLFNLLRCASETVKNDDGFSAMALSVIQSESVNDEQLHFADDEANDAKEDFGHLIERLRARLTPDAVLFPSLVPSHMPERAFALSSEPPSQGVAVTVEQRKSRPLYLVSTPEEIRCIVSADAPGDSIPQAFVHHDNTFNLVHASGPEKISGIWWEGRCKTREYFDVEATTGERFWIFRVSQTRRWFLHGFFDC
jgi:protein ImuB